MARLEAMPVDEYISFYRAFTFFDLAENVRVFADPSFEQKLREMSDFLVTHGYVGSSVDVAAAYDASIVGGIPY
jgi:hypothetical protein